MIHDLIVDSWQVYNVNAKTEKSVIIIVNKVLKKDPHHNNLGMKTGKNRDIAESLSPPQK